MTGWAQNWDTSAYCLPDAKWFGQMSLPRELSIKNGRMYQRPVKEIETLWKNKVVHREVRFQGAMELEGVAGRRIDMEMKIRPGDETAVYKKFAVYFAKNENYHTTVCFRPYESMLKIDRKFSGSRRAFVHQRRSQVNSKNGELRLRLILDRYSAEVFVNDGEQVLTMTIYTDQDADGISFFADGAVCMDVLKYELK